MSDYYWIATSDASFHAAANWSMTPGGIGGAGVPGENDSVFMSGAAKCSLSASVTVKNFDSSGWTGTLYSSVNDQALTVQNGEIHFDAIFDSSKSFTLILDAAKLFVGAHATLDRISFHCGTITSTKNLGFRIPSLRGANVFEGGVDYTISSVSAVSSQEDSIELKNQSRIILDTYNGTYALPHIHGDGLLCLAGASSGTGRTLKNSRIACETSITGNSLWILGPETELQKLTNATTVSPNLQLLGVQIGDWEMTRAASRTYRCNFLGNCVLTGHCSVSGSGGTISPTFTDGYQMTLSGENDQTIQSPFDGLEFTLDKPSGVIDFVSTTGKIRSKTERVEDDPRTVSNAIVVIGSGSTMTLSGNVCLAETRNESDSMTLIPAGMTLDTYTFSGVSGAEIVGPGTLRVHQGNYANSGDSSATLLLWNDSVVEPPQVPTGFTATPLSQTQIGVAWNPSLGATEYVLEVSSSGTSGWTELYRGGNTTLTDQ